MGGILRERGRGEERETKGKEDGRKDRGAGREGREDHRKRG